MKRDQKDFMYYANADRNGTLTATERKDYLKMVRGLATRVNSEVKDDRETYAKVEATAEKRAKSIMRLAIEKAIEVYAEAGLLDTPKAKSLKFSYNKKCNVKASAKNIELKFVSHSQTKANAKAKRDRKKARELKRKIADEKAREEQAKNERNENGVLYSELRNEKGVLYSAY